ncbi:MAG: hypothetical protein H7249_16650 [Chitinophagaceae bacterium]|nr:hypothetical protein [Oligoflexus sp.]
MRMQYGALIVFLGALSACRTTSSSSASGGFKGTIERSDAIHARIVGLLEKKYPTSKGTVWSIGTMNLAPDWIIQSPENLWGLRDNELATQYDCDVKDARCDKTFLRYACAQDSDCTTPSTHCGDMDAAVARPGDVPPKMCLAPADNLLNRFYRAMLPAESELDIASLSIPTGRFYKATINALTLISQKEKVPKVRLFFSGADAGNLNPLRTPTKILSQIYDDIRDKLYALGVPGLVIDRLHMNLGYLSNKKIDIRDLFTDFGSFVSWNHAKIIAADGRYALVGGHNMWDNDYLRPNHIFDISMEYSGQAAVGARDFLNKLWSIDKIEFASLPANAGRFPNFYREPTEADKGTIKSIGIGRLGVYGENPSDDALSELIRSAQESVLIDQQDLYNQKKVDLSLTFVMDAIIDVAARNVKVQIIQSNKFPVNGYGNVSPKDTYAGILDKAVKTFVKEGADKHRAEMRACANITYVPFRFSSSMPDWGPKRGTIGTHAKFVMVDEAAFYIGSHNLYRANLQEYGNIIADPTAAKQLKAAYWDKIWAQSAHEIIPCPYRS